MKSRKIERDVKQVIVIRKDLNMRKGKIASQVAHASMMFLLNNSEEQHADELKIKLSKPEQEWISGSFTKIVAYVESEGALRDLIFQAKLRNVEVNSVTDLGKTEFHGEPTLTCAAFGPEYAGVLDELTGNLKLL